VPLQVELAPRHVLGHVPAILGVVLYNISSYNADIQRECVETNAALLKLEVSGGRRRACGRAVSAHR
jgi:hypothetical protein